MSAIASVTNETTTFADKRSGKEGVYRKRVIHTADGMRVEESVDLPDGSRHEASAAEHSSGKQTMATCSNAGGDRSSWVQAISSDQASSCQHDSVGERQLLWNEVQSVEGLTATSWAASPGQGEYSTLNHSGAEGVLFKEMVTGSEGQLAIAEVFRGVNGRIDEKYMVTVGGRTKGMIRSSVGIEQGLTAVEIATFGDSEEDDWYDFGSFDATGARVR